MSEDTSKYIFKVKTVQSGAFRVLIESLKEILTDTNIIIDPTGIKLIATDNSQIVLIHMKLSAENFEFFFCEKKTVIGVNMMNMFKLIKAMSNNDTLTLFILKENPNRLGIRINNVEKNSQTTFQLNLLDINDIEIKSVGSTLILNCDGDFAKQETILSETQNGLSFSKSSGPEMPIQGVFSLKYLLLFTKCTNLCNLIHMYIKNDYPLVIRYDVANLGHIKLCLSPNIET